MIDGTGRLAVEHGEDDIGLIGQHQVALLKPPDALLVERVQSAAGLLDSHAISLLAGPTEVGGRRVLEQAANLGQLGMTEDEDDPRLFCIDAPRPDGQSLPRSVLDQLDHRRTP